MTYGSETWAITMVEMNVLRIFERKNVRKIHGPLKGRERWRITTNKKIKDMLNGEDTAKFIKSLQDSMVMLKDCKTRQWQNKLQQLRWKGQRKEDSYQIWRDEAEEDLSIMGVKNRWTVAGKCVRNGGNCTGSKGPHQAVVLEKKKKKITGSLKNLKPMLSQCRKPQ
jgi:hypothetical protein